MANEITVGASLSYSKSGRSDSYTASGLTFTLTGTKASQHIQNIGTSEEALLDGDVGTPGWCLLKNLDSTNYVEIRPGSGLADLVRLNAGEIALLRFAADATPYAIANTAACDLLIFILEN